MNTKPMIGIAALAMLVAVVVGMLSNDPHDYDMTPLPRYDSTLNTVVIDFIYTHAKNCHYCATNSAPNFKK